jgi:ABC-type lipoprotein release transport system permease subunit
MFIITGPAAGYAMLMIARVFVMAGTTRGPELTTLRYLGASRARLRWLLLCETAAAFVVGITLAAAVTGASLLAYRSALLREFAVAPPTVAWSWCVTVAAASPPSPVSWP